MTSFRQIDANRRNAVRSTGPVTQAGKHRSRRNAIRHGLCAETVIGTLEDIDDYRGFEAAIIADYGAETAVERELVLRLASLLWRVRRATAIETNAALTHVGFDAVRVNHELQALLERLPGEGRKKRLLVLLSQKVAFCELGIIDRFGRFVFRHEELRWITQ